MKPKIKVADLAKALQGIETDRQLTKEIVEDQKNFKKISHDLFSVLTINKNHHFSNETRKFLDANKLDINDFILELEGFLSEKKEELFITQETNECSIYRLVYFNRC